MKISLLIIFLTLSALVMWWGIEKDWLTATPVADPEIYKTRAYFLIPSSFILAALGIGIYVCMGKRERH